MGFTKNTKTLKKHTLLLLFRLCLIVQCYEQKIITLKNITKSVVICTSRQFENFVQKEATPRNATQRYQICLRLTTCYMTTHLYKIFIKKIRLKTPIGEVDKTGLPPNSSHIFLYIFRLKCSKSRPIPAGTPVSHNMADEREFFVQET